MKNIWPAFGTSVVFIGVSFILDKLTQQFTFIHPSIPVIFFVGGVVMFLILGILLAASFVLNQYLAMKLAH